MSDLRQAYASTALAGLGWDENIEKAIDRVAAAGRATALGISLWRAKYQLESRAYADATAHALKMFRARYGNESDVIAEALVGQAMHEYFSPACRVCQGRGEMLIDERKVICDACAGTKVHKFTDEERCGTMRISAAMTKHCAFKLSWLLGVLESEDFKVNHELNIQLERILLDVTERTG